MVSRELRRALTALRDQVGVDEAIAQVVSCIDPQVKAVKGHLLRDAGSHSRTRMALAEADRSEKERLYELYVRGELDEPGQRRLCVQLDRSMEQMEARRHG